eukprot:GHRR01020276.1.p1 GENE.GHRR01020276.1~~GHRR01020276.1.p1  ORF type:complete len:269 (+),score=29.88 GHRR01020276.1:469-1275(+)
MRASVIRWAVNVATWAPTGEQWSLVLGCLPDEARERCLRYRKTEDQKRAVVSQLLQRACVHRVLGEAWHLINIKLTRGRKPFYAGAAGRQHAPNFNYNVAHEGDYVVLASENHCLCGVDVAAPQQWRQQASKPVLERLSLLQNQLSAQEWDFIKSLQDNEEAAETAFQAMWSCKEAYVKARGDGVAFEPLSRIDVQLPSQLAANAATWPPMQKIQVLVDGGIQPCWHFCLHILPNRHIVAVARGPPGAAVDAYGVSCCLLVVNEHPLI